MKSYLTILSIVIISLNICQAQDTLKKDVRLLKESIKIDSLISSFINANETIKIRENDSCVLLMLQENNDDAGEIQGIRASNHKSIIFGFANFENSKSIGYFEFSGYLVFVYGDSFMNRFFTYTKSKKEFVFIKPTIYDNIFIVQHFLSWTLFYDHGKFREGVH
jgi:hypothetical protein